MPEYVIRPAKKGDAEAAGNLIVRLKRLNGEFDPLFKVVDDADGQAQKYLVEAMRSESSIVLVAEIKDKVVGVVKADVRDRRFYEPSLEGNIVDFYVLPEFRRRKLGKDLVAHMVKALRKRGAEIITAEFPAQNKIAVSFYEKEGFKPLVHVYATRQA